MCHRTLVYYELVYNSVKTAALLHEKLTENVTDAFSVVKAYCSTTEWIWLRFGYHSALLRALERN